MFATCWRHLGDLGRHCSVGLPLGARMGEKKRFSEDRLPKPVDPSWQLRMLAVGGNRLKTSYLQNHGADAMYSAWKILKVKQKGALWNSKGANTEPKRDQNISQNLSGPQVGIGSATGTSADIKMIVVGRHLDDLECNFGSHYMLKGQSACCS